MKAIVGIDIAKEKFDVCLLDENNESHFEEFANSKSGINRFHQWLKKRDAKQAHLCLEATGIYGDLLAETMFKRGYDVSVVNPARIKSYARSQMIRNKTDRIDASVIADFCRTQELMLWEPPSPQLKELKALVRHYETLIQEKVRVQNRLSSKQNNAVVKRQLTAQLSLIKKQIDEILSVIKEHINKHSDLKQQDELLKSIPGIRDITSFRLLGELGDIRRFDNVRQVVAFIGINPRQHQSGKRYFTQGISRMGRRELRAALFLPAMTARHRDSNFAAFAKRLEAKQLKFKQVIVAVMRKLIHVVYGVLKSGKAYDPHFNDRMPVAA